jgi:hypothetical protein
MILGLIRGRQPGIRGNRIFALVLYPTLLPSGNTGQRILELRNSSPSSSGNHSRVMQRKLPSAILAGRSCAMAARRGGGDCWSSDPLALPKGQQAVVS